MKKYNGPSLTKSPIQPLLDALANVPIPLTYNHSRGRGLRASQAQTTSKRRDHMEIINFCT